MTATHSTLTTVLVAIDISKHRHEVLIGIPGKKAPPPHDDYEHAGGFSAIGHRSRQL